MKERDLGKLIATAENAAGLMHMVAGFLEDMASGLPKRDERRREQLLQHAELLSSTARALKAAAYIDPKATSAVSRGARLGLQGSAAILLGLIGGSAEGVTSTVAAEALDANERAVAAVEYVEQLADEVAEDQAKLTELVHRTEELRGAVVFLASRATRPLGQPLDELLIPMLSRIKLNWRDLVPDSAVKASTVLTSVEQAIDQLAAQVDTSFPPGSDPPIDRQIVGMRHEIADLRAQLGVAEAPPSRS